jgi:hypothetical protein
VALGSTYIYRGLLWLTFPILWVTPLAWVLLFIFLLALAVRVAFVLAWDPPLLFTHQYNYFNNVLRIAEHADPVGYVLSTDEWRTWVGGSTIAPLYYLVLGAFFRWFGPSLLGLRVFQSILDALVAVAAASLGRRLAGPSGLFAGVAYAFYWSAVEMTCWTMTENLHTVLLASSLALMAREASAANANRGGAFVGGLLLGLSGLARSVSSAFVPVAALWRATLDGLAWPALRRSLVPAALLLCGCLDGRPLSEVVAVMPRFAQAKENVRVPHPAVPPRVAEEVARLNDELSGRGRVLVRPSGTEPFVRVLAEAEDAEEARQLCGTVASLVRTETSG